MSKLISTIFVVCMLTATYSINLRSQQAVTSTQAPNIFFTIDNFVKEFLVNGVSILPVGGLPNGNNWWVTQSLYFPIKPTDVISVTGQNEHGPAAMLLSINYFDAQGNQQVLNSGAGWICDGKPANTKGANGVGPWGLRFDIDPKAVWIWDSDSNSNAISTCTFTVPLPDSDVC